MTRDLTAPFSVGEVIIMTSSIFKVLDVEGTPHPEHVNLIVQPVAG